MRPTTNPPSTGAFQDLEHRRRVASGLGLQEVDDVAALDGVVVEIPRHERADDADEGGHNRQADDTPVGGEIAERCVDRGSGGHWETGRNVTTVPRLLSRHRFRSETRFPVCL